VIGAGRWGEKLIAALNATGRYRLTAICDPDAERLTRYRGVSAARLLSSAQEALHDRRVEAVFVATPPQTHASLTIAALRAGKHVFVEKPMTLSLVEAEAVGRVLRATGRQLLVGHVLRYHQGILELERLVQAGAIGTLHHFASQRLGRAAPGGTSLAAWWELAPHDVSLARLFLGGDAEFISARASACGQSIEALLQFPRGRTADVLVGALETRRVRRITLGGTDGSACFDDRGPTSRARIQRFDGSAARPLDVAEELDARGNTRDALSVELNHFADAVVHDRPVLTDFEEGERVVAVLEAGARSLANGGQRTRIGLRSDIAPAAE
jgi:predicted dehydrogenase